tara:strand:+ start:670 stop:2349 length:1680 start_codon:yes stop_codon:yes gene_type:complete
MANEYGNYANALTLAAREQTNFNPDSQSWTYTNGGLTFEHTASGGDAMFPFSQPMQPGSKYHFEFTTNSFHSSVYASFAFFLMPVVEYEHTSNPIVNSGSKTFVATLNRSGGSGSNSAKFNTGALTAPSNRPTTGSRITIEVDMSTVGSTTVRLYFNGSLDQTYSSLAFTDTPYYVGTFTGTETDRNGVFSVNFGQTDFADTVTADHIRLNTASMSEPTIINPDDHFYNQVVAHDGSSTTFTLPWNADTYDTLFIVKNTTGAAEDWYWTNGLRGYNKYQTLPTLVSETTSTTILTINGTSVTLGSTLGNKSYLVECHKAGLASGRVTDDTGARTVTRSTNTTSQFSIISRTGTGANTNYGHGLDAVDWRISLNLSSAHSFSCQHTSLTDGSMILYMDGTGGQNPHATGWNSTFPSPTLCFLGSGNGVNQNNSTYNEYLWGPVDGYSAFGGYEGNAAADGAFINIGFAQQIMFVRNIDATENWVVKYQVLDNTNENTSRIYYDQTAVADTSTSSANMDMVSNGFKNRGSNSQSNSAATFIYASWGGRPMTNGSTNQGRAK